MRPMFAVLATLLAFPGAASKPTTSTVTGTIIVSGSKSADPANVAVWLSPERGDAGTNAAPVRRFQILQKNKRFTPPILIVPIGSEVAFPNADPFFHNVFSMFDGKRFDLGLYEAGSSRSVTFTREGVCFIFCNIHPEMNAIVIVVDTPYATLSNAAGMFSIPDIPAGRYTLSVWHQRYAAASAEAIPKDVVVADATVDLGVVRLVDSGKPIPQHKNKYGHDYDPPAPASPIYGK